MNTYRTLCRLFYVCLSFMTFNFSFGDVVPQGRNSDPPFKIVFLGDSITESGIQPEGYVTQIQAALSLRHPDRALEIVGKGISGNRVPDLLERLQRDVLDLNPDLVVIYIGINDVWHSLEDRGTPIEEFESGLKAIIESIQNSGAKVLLCTPSVIGEKTDGSNPLDEMLDQYAEISRKLAALTGFPLIDLREMFLQDLKILNLKNESQGIFTSDGVHLNEAGNEFVQECMLPAIETAILARVLKHVVFFKFKSTSRIADINRVVDAFANLPSEIDFLMNFEFGQDVSPEGLSQGYTHAFSMDFKTAEDRDQYLVHPAHQKFVELVKPHLDGVTVIDFWAR